MDIFLSDVRYHHIIIYILFYLIQLTYSYNIYKRYTLVMDIPRGNFSSIRRDIPLSSILAEVAETLFSGHAMVNYGGTSISLVFSEGACILAEYQGLQGAPAWEAIKNLDGSVEVALYLLTGPQIRLAAEFNAKATVSRPDEPLEEPPRPVTTRKAGAGPAKSQGAPLQVPRGHLIEIRRDEIGSKTLEELTQSDFTGYAIFNLDPNSFTLVFSGGICVLAEGGGERGTPVLRKVREGEVPGEVAVYSLTGPQLALAQEFNQGCRVRGDGKRPASRPTSPARRCEVGAMPEPLRPGTQDAAVRQGVEKRPKRDPYPREPADVSHEDPVLRDLAALDAINVDQMAVDLKDSYISILDRLELGHLIEKDKEKGVK
jgi:hypothetical protein